ncbi:MAG TPA: hypothetical protein VL501_00340, partial [Pyrinomonadaceae bacterium]|nr:hypothetical protein [Pyrinomonadaceae bacterium]
IDYNWLLDKFANQALLAEQDRKEKENAKLHPEQTPIPSPEPTAAPDPSRLQIYLYAGDKTIEFYVAAEAGDADVLAAAQAAAGRALTDQEKEQVRNARQTAYASRFNDSKVHDYEGGYWGEEKMTPNIVPAFLRQDPMTDWIFSYQMTGPEASAHSLSMYKASGSQLWLMAALSQADNNSPELAHLVEAADRSDRGSAAYPTIAYHAARLLLAQNKQAEARKLIEDALTLGDTTLNTSARNSFITLRLSLAQTLEDWLRDSLIKPYAFDFDGEVGTMQEFMAEQKKWFDPEYNKEGKEAYEKQVEQDFKDKLAWQERTMFDDPTIETLNQHFPTASLIGVMQSPALPDYMRERFALALWTRAWLLKDDATLNKMTPELIRYHPEFETQLNKVIAAKTPAARENALLFFVLKNPILNPYIPDGMGRTNNEQDTWADDNWWCAPYDTEWDESSDSEVPRKLPKRPAFLTPAQAAAAQAERKKLSDIGDAPKFLAEKVQAWAKRSPADRRVPEALYIVIQANGWTKYGCGNNEELRDEMSRYLRSHYPGSEWVRKLDEDESGK